MMINLRSPSKRRFGSRLTGAVLLFLSLLVTSSAYALGAVHLLPSLLVSSIPGDGGAVATLMKMEGPSDAMLWSFGILAGLTLLGALATITRSNPVTAALCLVWTLFCSAGLYILLHASFMAVIQVLVYAGAIMVLFVLVVMSVERPEEEELGLTRGLLSKLVGILSVSFLLILFVLVLSGPEAKRATSEENTLCGGASAVLCSSNFECQVSSNKPDADGKCIFKEGYGDVKFVGNLLFSQYLFPFEAISLLLLVSIVGAVVVSRRRQGHSADGEAEADGRTS